MNVIKKQLNVLASRLKNLASSVEDPIKKELEEIKEMQLLGFRDFQDLETLLKTVKVGEQINADGNPSTLDELTDDWATWITTIYPSGGFGSHWHLEEEYCDVLKGELVDELNPSRIYKAGETAYFPGKVRHVPANPSAINKTLLRVRFKRIK